MLLRSLARTSGIALVCVLSAIVVACGGGGGAGGSTPPVIPVATPAPSSISTTVPIVAAQGGTVTLSDGASITIPAGLLSADANVTLSRSTQSSAVPIDSWVSASSEYVVSLGAIATSSKQRQATSVRFRSSVSGDVPFSIPFSSALRPSILQSNLAVVQLQTNDSTAPYIAANPVIDAVKNLATGVVASAQLAAATTTGFSIKIVTFAESYHFPTYGPVYYSKASHSWQTGTTLSSGRTLVLVHGMLSSVQDTFGPDCVDGIIAAGGYEQVVGYDYDWTQPPYGAARGLVDFINGLNSSWVDIEAHSYGTVVTLAAVPSLSQRPKNVVLLNGPLPYYGVPADADQPLVLDAILLNFIGAASKQVDPGAFVRAYNNGMLGSLIPASTTLNDIAGNLQKLSSPPRYIQAAGTAEYQYKIPNTNVTLTEKRLLQILNVGVVLPFDGLIEERAARSRAVSPVSAPAPTGSSFPYTHTELPCKADVTQFVAGSLLTPAPISTPTPGPVTASVSSLTFTQVGAGNSQQFTVTQSNYTGSFTLSGNNTAVATAQISGNTVTVTPVASGSTSLTISGGAAKSVAIPISVSSTSTPTPTPTPTSTPPSLTFTIYSVSPNAGLIGITPGPDGAVWFAEAITNKIGRITTSGQIMEFQLPAGNAGPWSIITGPDGALWFTQNNGRSPVASVSTAGQFTEPSYSGPFCNYGITAGPDGAVWFASACAPGIIGRMTTSGQLQTYANGNNPRYITAGPDGALWFTEDPSTIGRITTSGQMVTFGIPSGYQQFGEGIVAGPDKALWFTLVGTPSAIGRMTTSGRYSVFPLSSNYAIGGIVVGPDGALWFADQGAGAIGRITTSGQIAEYTVPSQIGPRGLTFGPDGALWFTDCCNGRIGRAVLH